MDEYRGPWGMFQDPQGCLKLQLVPDPSSSMFFFLYVHTYGEV